MIKEIRNVLVFTIILLVLISIPTRTFATGESEDSSIDQVTETPNEATTISNQDANSPLNDDRTLSEKSSEMFPNGSGADAGLPQVTMDEASSWMERKGFEIIGFLQKFVQPFAIIVFIICGLLVLAGSFGNGKLVSSGLFGMFVSLIMYVVVLYAPEIMDAFLGWVQS